MTKVHEPKPVGAKPEKMLTSEEVCDWLSIDPRTLIRYRNSKLIPSYKIGANVRFDRKDIQAFLRKNRRG